MRRAKHLPNRVPVGTKYVIEGRGGRVTARFIEFPDGRRVDLMGTVNQAQLSGIDSRPAGPKVRLKAARRTHGPSFIVRPAPMRPGAGEAGWAQVPFDGDSSGGATGSVAAQGTGCRPGAGCRGPTA